MTQAAPSGAAFVLIKKFPMVLDHREKLNLSARGTKDR
jgi:hypothetical protein